MYKELQFFKMMKISLKNTKALFIDVSLDSKKTEFEINELGK